VAVGAAVVCGCNLILLDGNHYHVVGASGGGGASSTGGFTVTPMTTTLLAYTTLAFSAGSGSQVTWSIVENGGGKVTPQGTYTAPADAGTFHLQASSGGQTATATITVVKTATPVTIVASDALATATGHGSQRHLAYAHAAGQWWLLHDPSSDKHHLATMYTSDFVNWTPGSGLYLSKSHSSDGRELSVAYRSLNGYDVLHITQGYDDQQRGRYHIRAVVTNGNIQFGNPLDVNGGAGVMPDGAATAILSNGLVVDGTGQLPTPPAPPLGCGQGDFNVYTSTVKDDGATDFSMPTAFNQDQVLWCVGGFSEARQILAIGNVAVHLGADTDAPSNVLTNLRPDVAPDAGTTAWLPKEPYGQPDAGLVPLPAVFQPTMTSFDRNDWTSAVWGGTAHAVRRAENGAFEHRVMSMVASGPSWQPGGGVSTLQTPQGSGLFLGPYADSLLLLAISDDGYVEYAAYDDTGAWSPWQKLCSVPPSTVYLSGFSPDLGAKPAIIWTQPAGDAGFAIAGALLP
jgi:hypothetical protein